MLPDIISIMRSMRSILGWSIGLWGFHVIYFLAMGFGVFYFTAGTGTNVPSRVDDVNAVSHVNLALVHVVQHLFGAFGPDFVVAAMAEEAVADDDVAFEGKPLLRFQELVLEASAAAEGYDGVFADHKVSTSFKL